LHQRTLSRLCNGFTRVAMDYLEQNNINVLTWPSKSPNPIEHLWDQLDKRVRQRQPPPQTPDQLRQKKSVYHSSAYFLSR
jgi:hypothetical protein